MLYTIGYDPNLFKSLISRMSYLLSVGIAASGLSATDIELLNLTVRKVIVSWYPWKPLELKFESEASTAKFPDQSGNWISKVMNIQLIR